MAVKRTTNMALVERWQKENAPMAKEKLAVAAQVSPRTVEKLFLGNFTGKNGTRFRVAQALGVSEDELFPEVKKRA